ncbi:unnamed protein product [Phytophthora lilii]|uniref:Unnamed protein product n=1 Tax=Phytophthora lilii TaxID=2077276 RepID=A0A9W6XEQ7_9STRA|nr:unnamed protein product [Phytophthora lilii]
MSDTQLSDQYLYQSSLKSDPEIKVSSGKRVPFVVDLNQGSYQNGVITIDATAQLNGSEGFACLRDAYIMLPYKVSMKNGATPQTLPANRFCSTLKCVNWNVIDSMSLELNGKTVVSMAVLEQCSRSDELQPSTARGAFVSGVATANGIMGTWNYMLKVKLTDLYPIFNELDLMANPQIRLRFRVNQGVSTVAVHAAKGMSLTSTTLSSANACSVMVAASMTGNPMTGVLATSAGFSIAWGAVVNSLEPTIDGTYMPITTSRIYVPFVHLENPQAIISKPVKKVRYNDCYAQWFYQRAGTGKQSTQLNAAFDLQLSASVRNAKYVILLPFAEQTSSFASAAVQ